jgi:polar amino acid transport system substrate-binding protein
MIAPRLLLAGLVVAVAVTGCATSSDRAIDVTVNALTDPTTTTEPATTTTTTTPEPCDQRSFRPGPLPPPGVMPAGSSMEAIQARGYLIAAVDENTLPLSYRDPESGELRGFEIDLVRELARAILGSPDAVQLVTVTTGQKITIVEQGQADISVSANSISCDRWAHVAFSTPYFQAFQRMMVREDSAFEHDNDLVGHKVCVTIGSSSIAVLERELPGVDIEQVETRTDCLVDLQDGDVDAIFTHDTFLAGFVEQDPDAEILPGALSEQLYGIAINHDEVDLVRFVNGVLERLRADGSLAASAAQWFEIDDALSQRPIPEPSYRD